MDGTIILATTLAYLSNAFRNRYGRIAQNVLCACDFDMKFIYVYTGWEGKADDIFINALSRIQNQLPWPQKGVLNHRSSMQNMVSDTDAGELSHVIDMSTESAKAKGAMRDAIALPMWALQIDQ
ncbi:hypothetical protein F2P56_024422 [Juglans regia]|uniref:Uncharacterized protein n=1 Tax=Juglans regia TaxID=51240 RepID=A0A833UH20_JUGRE|nr:hypothetical protein F2P56_024422 [Juglans regia]